MPARGYALLISVILGWGLAWPMIKIGVTEVPPLAYRGLMLPIAGIWAIGFVTAETSGGRFWLHVVIPDHRACTLAPLDRIAFNLNHSGSD